jgi:hypothetical protein
LEQDLVLDQSIYKSPGSNGKLKLLDGVDYFRLFIFPSIGQQNQESIIIKKTIS